MHGNASSQHEGQFPIRNLWTGGISLFCFGFAGSDHVSLGYYETMDLIFLMVLWGRR
jgi:hypothetical protein